MIGVIARLTALAVAGAAVLAPVQATNASAAKWRYVKQYRTLTVCQKVGRAYVVRHRARAYKCENDYNRAGDPTLDLYLR